jgi:N-acetylglucosamine transport system permease protein
MRRSRAGFALAFLSPALILYGVFVLWPLVQSVQLSFYQWKGVSTRRKFVGFGNFQDAIEDSVVGRSWLHAALLVLIAGAVTITLALLIAHLVEGRSRVAELARRVMLIPHVISLVTVGLIWSFLLNPTFGLLNATLKAVNLGGLVQPWLAKPLPSFAALAAAFVWYAVGFFILLFTAGMRQIPEEVREASGLDGASGWRAFSSITWPLLWSVKRIAVTYVVIWILNLFSLVELLTEGGPDRATEVPLTYLYEQMIGNGKFGYASALAVINIVLAFAASGAVLWIFRRDPTAGRQK